MGEKTLSQKQADWHARYQIQRAEIERKLGAKK
jgi:hypothetical protein